MRARDIFDSEEYDYVKEICIMFNARITFISDKGRIVYRNKDCKIKYVLDFDKEL